MTIATLLSRKGVEGMDTLVKLATMSFVVALVVGLAVPALADETGTVSGTVVDTESGEALIGATVQLEGTSQGAKTDLDGKFTIRNVPLGTYNLIVRSVGYQNLTITGVVVEDGKANKIDVALTEESIELGETITVTAKQMKNNQAALLKDRQKATSVSDAISAEEISKSGASDAADAMTKVTGASVVGGKFVYVRGLGGRYANTHINGSPVPSPNPDAQSVPLDMVPSGLLDNIVVTKTFTPDKPGNFTGGSVDLVTRDFPEYRQITFSTSVGYNSAITGEESMLTTPPGSKDWAGYDDGKRAIPGEIDDRPELDVPQGRAFINEDTTQRAAYEELIDYLETTAGEFDPNMEPIERNTPWDQKYALSYGDQFQLFNRPLGVIASFSYSKSYKGYTDGINRRLRLTSPTNDELTRDWDMTEQMGSEEVLWGGLVNFNYTIHPNHKLGVKYTRNQSGINKSEFLFGQAREITSQDTTVQFRTRLMEYIERNLWALQFNGEHSLPSLNRSRVEWNISTSETRQENPDRRQFADERFPNLVEDPQTGDLFVDGYKYEIAPAAYTVPTRFWRDLTEDNFSVGLDYTQPYADNSRLKFGVNYLEKNRDSFESQYRYARVTTYSNYDGDAYAFFSDVGVGSVDTLSNGRRRWIFDNYLWEFLLPNNNYRGTQEIFAYYGMVEHQLLRRLRVIGGARIERTDMRTETNFNPLFFDADPEDATKAEINETDVLPSVNLVYALTNEMNIRAAYGKTVARPSLLEMTPVIYESVSGGRQLNGNPDLERTTVDNFDLRWEWFMRPGEILALSAYYKKFKDPIEEVIFDVNGNIKFLNVPDATVYGFELEFRRRLDHVGSALRNFSMGGNLTLVDSKVDLTEAELLEIREVDPNAEDTRPMQGQSPYILNFDIGYDNPLSGTTVTALFNVYGERLSFNSEDFTPDIYEQPHNQIDLIASQRIFANASLKLSVKNLLNETIEFTQEHNGEKVVAEAYNPGRSLSFGISYSL